jgi:hypothetical protein
MPVQGSDPQRPAVLQPFVTPQLMVDPRKQGPQLVRIDAAHDLPQAVGTRFLLSDQSFHSARLAQLPFHGM